MTDIISVERLTKFYGTYTALDEVSFSVPKGSCLGYLGPNGSGKSTTIKIMTGLVKAYRGEVQLFGHDVGSDLKNALFDVGAMVETPVFPRYLSPDEVLSFIGELRGISGSELLSNVERVLELVRLTEWKNKPLGEFSKGMNQRLALASALLSDPELLILDEPTSGLDPMGMADIRDILRSLKRMGKTIFLSTHLIAEVKELCDTVVMLDRGKVVFSDSMENISRTHVANSIRVRLLHEPSSEQIAFVKNINRIREVEKDGKHGLILEYEGGLEDRIFILKMIVEADFKIISFEEYGNTLESLYKEQVSGSVN